MPTIEGIRSRILKFIRINFANYRQKKLNKTEFTIISNNCWGGMIYESYNLVKQSPTIGCYFMAKDYVDFCQNIHAYLDNGLKFIDPKNSKWANSNEIKKDNRFGMYPIGLLTNGNHTVEVMFLHYKSEDSALEKWNRRVSRINWDNIIFKFNDQNGCNEKDVESFIELPYKNKIFFTCKKWDGINLNKNGTNVYIRKQYKKTNEILWTYEFFGRRITRIINNL